MSEHHFCHSFVSALKARCHASHITSGISNPITSHLALTNTSEDRRLVLLLRAITAPFGSQVKFQQPSDARDKECAHKTDSLVFPEPFSLAACFSRCRAGCIVRHFDSLVHSEVSGVAVRFLLKEKARHIPPCCTTRSPASPALRGTAVLREAKFHQLGSGSHHRQYKALL
jgi:hypothetical protein